MKLFKKNSDRICPYFVDVTTATQSKLTKDAHPSAVLVAL